MKRKSASKSSGSLGGKIRDIADRLKQETEVQKKATARILSAAAQISQNHEQLINEVVEMVEEDLERQSQRSQIVSAGISSINTDIDTEIYTVEKLKKQFKTLRAAKEKFNIHANSWGALVKQLNSLVSSQKEIHHLENQVIHTSKQEVDTNKNDGVSNIGDRNQQNTTLQITIEADVAEFFPNSQAVNEALRFLIRITNQNIQLTK